MFFFVEGLDEDFNVVVGLVFLLNLLLSWVSLLMLREYVRGLFQFARKASGQRGSFRGIGYRLVQKTDSYLQDEGLVWVEKDGDYRYILDYMVGI